MRRAIAGALFACLFSSAALAAASVETKDLFDRNAAAEQPGRTVRLAGDFQITRHNDTYSITLASTAAPEPESSGRSSTELALKCWLGVVEFKGCRQSHDCDAAGPVQRVEYLGSTATGGEVYQVRYQFENNAYVIVSDPKGNAGQYLAKPTDKYWIKRQISPPAAPILIYTRPENARPVCPHDYGFLYGPGGDNPLTGGDGL
jgi:hypothetical protein